MKAIIIAGALALAAIVSTQPASAMNCITNCNASTGCFTTCY